MLVMGRSFDGLDMYYVRMVSRGNVLSKRAGQASEPVKILHILPSTTDYISKVEDIEIKQIVS
jgi:hypothetical protein